MTRAERIQAINATVDEAIAEGRTMAISRLSAEFEELCRKWGPRMQAQLLTSAFSAIGTEEQLTEIEAAVRVALAKD